MKNPGHFMRRIFPGYQIRSYVVGLFLVSTLWVVLAHFVQWIWLAALVHLAFVIWTVALGVQLFHALELLLPPVLVWLFSVGIWFFNVIVIRYLEVSLLEKAFPVATHFRRYI